MDQNQLNDWAPVGQQTQQSHQTDDWAPVGGATQQQSLTNNARQNIKDDALGTLVGTAENAAQNIPLVPQIAAGVNATLGQSTGNSWGERYKQSLANQEAVAEANKEENPYLAKAGQGTGLALGMALPVGEAAQAAKTWGQLAKTGAKVGAGYGTATGAAEAFDPTQNAEKVLENTALGGVEGGVAGGVTGGILGPAVAGAMKGIGAGWGAAKNAASYVSDKFGDFLNTPINKEAATLASTTAPSEKLDQIDIVRNHAATQQGSDILTGDIANNMRKMARDDTVNASSAENKVNSLLDQIQKDGALSYNNARPEDVAALKGVLDRIDNGEMSVSDALTLNTVSNKYYRDNNNGYKGMWNEIHGIASKLLNSYGSDNPEFAQMRLLLQNHMQEDVGNAYRSNDTLQGIIHPDDIHNIKTDNENATDTQVRSRQIVDKINDLPTYQAVQSGIGDPSISGKLDDELLKKTAPSVAKSLSSVFVNLKSGNIGGVLKSVASALPSKSDLPASSQEMVDFIKNKKVADFIGSKLSDAGINPEDISGKSSDEANKILAKSGLNADDVNWYSNYQKQNTPTVQKLLDVRDKSNEIMGKWNDRVQNEAARDESVRSYTNYNQFEHSAGQLQKEGDYIQMQRKLAEDAAEQDAAQQASEKANRKLLTSTKRPDYVVSREGVAAKAPSTHYGPEAQFGEVEGLPYLKGERDEVNARSGNYQQMPIGSSQGQRAFTQSVGGNGPLYWDNKGVPHRYEPMNPNAGDEPQFEKKARGGSVPDRNEWSLVLRKTRALGHNFTVKDRLNPEKIKQALTILQNSVKSKRQN